jgi:hypothetical protein
MLTTRDATSATLDPVRKIITAVSRRVRRATPFKRR